MVAHLCSFRIHNKPAFSQTVVLQNLYINPQNSAKSADGAHLTSVTDEEMQEHYDNFFEDCFMEAEDKYGEVEEMNVCDNLGDHLVGNVYIKFRREEDADRAVKDLNNRWFGGRPIYAELSPVTDFREACCRQVGSQKHNTLEATGGHIFSIFSAFGELDTQKSLRAGAHMRTALF